MRRCLLLCSAFISLAAQAQYTGLYPDGIDVSRAKMPGERALPFQIQADPPSTPPPLGPVRCVAEYEPMDAIIIAWEGTTAQNNILAAMAKEFTSVDGNANVWVMVDTSGEQSLVDSQLQASGVNMSRVRYFIDTTDTIWCRDYGPRYVYQGNCRAIVKHTYNRNRPNDNLLSLFLGGALGQSVYQIPLIHGGGNYHLDALGRSWATRLTDNENPTKTESQIVALWKRYQNCQTTMTDPFSTTIDSTQHIDMWMQIVGDNTVVISDWPQEPGSAQDNICDTTAASMQALGYTVFRVPAFRSGGTHYTYTNIVICNGVAIVPSYTVGSYNAEALATWQAALPGKRVVQMNCQALVTSAGVVHCIVMHVPKFKGSNGAPLAYCAYPNGGEKFVPGQHVTVRWAADDDVAVTSVDVLLSTDGGANYSTVAGGIASTGSYDWTVPSVYSPACRIKVVAHDADTNGGEDVSDRAFAIVRGANGSGVGE
ncbi:MAG: agmatine deiminase family protein [Armatimonadetes bacterium]|nr:agmatine deiminase family protein [Armatimonadota bacterium]